MGMSLKSITEMPVGVLIRATMVFVLYQFWGLLVFILLNVLLAHCHYGTGLASIYTYRVDFICFLLRQPRHLRIKASLRWIFMNLINYWYAVLASAIRSI